MTALTHPPYSGKVMPVTDPTTNQEAPMPTTPVIRTYESFSIQWDRGSTWSGYDTAAEAQEAINRSRSTGHVLRKTWDMLVPADCAHIYKPGISERAA